MMTLAKGSHVPPQAVRSAARRGLELRKKHGKGGLTTQEAGKQGIGSGVARASNLAAGDAVSTGTLRRMVAFFSRHRKNKSGGEDDAGYIAWLLWGGDPGEAWAKRELAKVDRVEKGGTMLQPLIDLVEVQQPGWLELPRSYALALGDGLAKGLSHRYIRRVPTGKVTKTGKPRYRYYYHAAHGGTVGNEDHFVVGASFKDDDGHWHITGRDGDTLTLKHDETGAESTMTKRELRDHLVGLHREAIAGAQERARQDIADAKASGASGKQVARLRERAARVGVTDPKGEAKPAMFSEGSYTSKKGNLKKVAVFTGRVSGDEFKALAATAKEHGGSYIRDAGGFVFMGDAGFASFMAAQGGEPAPAKVEAPEPSVAKVEPKASPVEPQRKAPRIAKWTAPEYGSKYDGKRGMVDIAKDVRSDIKAAVKAGAIPEGVKLSIRSEDGRSIRVAVKEAPFQVLNPARMEKDRDDPHTYTTIPIHTPEAKEVLDRIEAIVDSYNRKRHNGGPFDDPSVAFYSNVSYDYDLHKRDREAFKAGAAPKVAVVAPLRSQVKPEDLAPKNTAAQVTKLRETAAKVRADADAELGKDRNVNTRRRAEMASGIIERAERQGKLADAIGRAADAIEAGDAPALAAMTSKAQAQVLQNVARLAHMKSMSYGEWERSGADAMHPPADVIRYIDRLPGEESSATLARMGVTSVPKLQTAVAEWLRVTDPKGAATSGAAASKRAEIEESNLMRQGITGYFPTPKPLADKMVHAAHIERGMTVLEPSAGSGRIADAAKAAGADVAVVERSSALREHLKGKGYDLAGDDALGHSGKYDRVVMNPPFEGMQDVDHVRHAFENNLKPGGRLVAIMGEGPFFREDKKAQAFREWLDANGGYSEKLPSGTFESSGTLVSSRMIVVDKPKVADPATATRDPRLDEADALTAKANQTWSVHTQVGSGSMRTKSHLRRIDADVKRSVEAAKLHQKAANLRAQVERERTQPAPVTAPAQPKAAEQPAKKAPQTINADQKARGVSKERAAAEAAAWKRAGKDLRGFYGGVPTIMRGGSLVALGSLSDAELGMGKGTLSPLLDLLGGA